MTHCEPVYVSFAQFKRTVHKCLLSRQCAHNLAEVECHSGRVTRGEACQSVTGVIAAPDLLHALRCACQPIAERLYFRLSSNLRGPKGLTKDIPSTRALWHERV